MAKIVRPSLLRGLAGLLLAGLVSACNAPSMTATAPLTGIRPDAATLSILDVSGPSSEQGQRFAAILAQEARSRGFVIAEVNAPVASSKLRAYLDIFAGPNGQPAISYVLQTSADGRNRAARVSGLVPASSGAGWTGFDDAAMRRVAGQSLDALARQLSGQPATGGDVAATPSEEVS
ncbi:MAG: hypothetical protein ACRDBL_06410 [Rhabdaerophilum sp.]